MRPHVELIQSKDLVWHAAELPRGEGKARQLNLSYDEEDGSASTEVHFDSDWRRISGLHHADTEWFVVEGEVRLGDRTLTNGGYFQAPRGLVVPPISAKQGTKILLYREYGGWGFDEIDKSWEDPSEDHITITDSEQMDWQPVTHVTGPPTGLEIKFLHRNPDTGFYSRLIWARPGWTDHRLAHHPVFEEAYTLDGTMVYNFGDLDPGTYFFRPARVKHGHFVSGEEKGCVWLIRSDGDLINWYTTNERVIVEGAPENYDPETQGPVIAGIPVRSRSTGEWTREGW